MDQKALKKVIKQLVRESLTEIFAEMQLEKIVESVVSKTTLSKSFSAVVEKPKAKYSVRETMNEQVIPKQQKPVMSSAEKKRIIMEKMGVKDDMWAGIYGDTAESNNPILEDSEVAGEEVPESVLENMGLMKDYSKHLSGNSKTVSNEDDEWRQRREAREKIMQESFKRA